MNAVLFQGLRRTTAAAEFNNYTLQGLNSAGRGRPENTYSLPAEGTREIAGTYWLTSHHSRYGTHMTESSTQTSRNIREREKHVLRDLEAWNSHTS